MATIVITARMITGIGTSPTYPWPSLDEEVVAFPFDRHRPALGQDVDDPRTDAQGSQCRDKRRQADNWVISRPLPGRQQEPTGHRQSSPESSASHRPSSIPVVIPERAITEPTDRSMPPVMITIVWPMATIAVIEMARATPSRLSCVKKILRLGGEEGAEDDQGDENVELFHPGDPAEHPSRG